MIEVITSLSLENEPLKMKQNIFFSIKASLLAAIFFVLTACSFDPGEAAKHINSQAPIAPEYQDCTIPVNIAPLNFRVKGATAVKAVFSVENSDEFTVANKGELVEIPENKWKTLLEKAKGKNFSVTVSAWNQLNPDGVQYASFPIYVSADKIDPYISYRLIEPGYEAWKSMGIYQRNLENFEEKAVVENRYTDRMCVNCHSYSGYNPDQMMFHARCEGGGTVIYKDGKLVKLNFKNIGPKKQGVYPMWHPEGRFIVLSSNDTHQTFYGPNGNPIEVYDISSDLILYDTKTDSVLTDSRFNDNSRWETFPAWDSTGKWLYFCSADTCTMPLDREKLHYDLLRVGFDSKTGKFSEKIDTVVSASKIAGSVSFPRLSPDGKFLMYTRSDFGTFPIWHPEADLKLVRLSDGNEIDASALNSDLCESYHSWSSNSRWVIFSSRRLDGRFTRLFIAHVDKNGKVGKPFLLPQSDPALNLFRIKSYNIPEFMKSEVKLPDNELKQMFK